MKQGFYPKAGKRAVDLLLTLPALVVAVPVCLVLGIGIRSSMGSPILFRQQRPGRDGTSFTLFKLRSMSAGNAPDAERLTRLGNWLRRTSLDELPELVNVLRGDMSLVGPRPLLPEYLELYDEHQSRRHDVLPGITGWAQVNGRNRLDWAERLKADVWYTENMSLKLDLGILLRTLGMMVRREGIEAAGHATMPKFEGSRRKPS